MQRACAILLSMAYLDLLYFSTLSHKHQDFAEKIVEHQMCVSIFLYNFYMKHFSFYEEPNSILSKMYIGFHVKHPLFLSGFN